MSIRGYFSTALLMASATLAYGQTRLEVRQSPVADFEVIDASQPAFEAVVSKLLTGPKSRAAVDPVLPYSVAVTNHGPRTIVCYTIVFSFTHADDKAGTVVQVRDYRRSEPKLVGEVAHLITPLALFTQAIGNGTSPPLPGEAAYASQMKRLNDIGGSRAMVVSVDAVVYDDGEFIGPDKSGSFDLFNVKSDYLRLADEMAKLKDEPVEVILSWLAKQRESATAATDKSSMQLVAGRSEAIELRSIGERLKQNPAAFDNLVHEMAIGYGGAKIWRRSVPDATK